MTNIETSQPDLACNDAPIRTVVVDDSTEWIDALCRFLQTVADIELVGTAMDGNEALTAIDRLQPELVVIDVQMPRMDGLETVARIRRRRPGTRIVMMSFCDAPETRDCCIAWGAHSFVPKSAQPSVLLTEIFRICERPSPESSTGTPES